MSRPNAPAPVHYVPCQRVRHAAMLALLALGAQLAGCQPEQADPDPGLASLTPPEDGLLLLDPRRQLIRLSVDLRGVHPSETDLASIEEHPEQYEAFVDRWLDDPRFPRRIADLYADVLHTRTGERWFDPGEAGLIELSDGAIADSLGDEPLRLIEHLVATDAPWTELVTADYVMADAVTAAMWDVDRGEVAWDAPGWSAGVYLDGRPMAGVLSSTTLWTRYPSAGVNNNRHRANAVSTLFLCDDYLSRPVSFSRTQIDALTGGDPEAVIRDTALCQSCHSTLDPLSSHFYGFWWEIEGGLMDQTTYRPEHEMLWREATGKSPAYYGIPTTGLLELGERLADDPRFVGCTVRTVFDGLTQRDTDDRDWSELAPHRAAFEAGGLTMRELVRSIVLSRPYRAGAAFDPDIGERVPTWKTVTPAMLSDIVAAKTGYRWTFRGRDGLRRNVGGLAVLAGGTDGRFVTSPSHDPSVGLVLIQERLAQAAAWHVVRHDLARGREGEALLLDLVTVDDRPDADEESRRAFEAQIRQLYRELTGVPLAEDTLDEAGERVPPPEVTDLVDLWLRLHAVEGHAAAAWSGVVSVVLRDPLLLFY